MHPHPHPGNEDLNRVLPTEELEINELTETSKNHVGPTVLEWKKQQREKTPKQQYVYKTFNDVLKDQTTIFHKKTQVNKCKKKLLIWLDVNNVFFKIMIQ
ncbi:unnamed protein product [Rotaria magnacalcarata]